MFGGKAGLSRKEVPSAGVAALSPSSEGGAVMGSPDHGAGTQRVSRGRNLWKAWVGLGWTPRVWPVTGGRAHAHIDGQQGFTL